MSNEVIFSKVAENKYHATNIDAVLKETSDVVNSISGSKVEELEYYTSLRLYDTILSRIIAREFFQQQEEGKVTFDKTNTFTSVDVLVNNRMITVSLGIVTANNKVYKTNGLIYQ